jgi:hypothetical protein
LPSLARIVKIGGHLRKFPRLADIDRDSQWPGIHLPINSFLSATLNSIGMGMALKIECLSIFSGVSVRIGVEMKLSILTIVDAGITAGEQIQTYSNDDTCIVYDFNDTFVINSELRPRRSSR